MTRINLQHLPCPINLIDRYMWPPSVGLVSAVYPKNLVGGGLQSSAAVTHLHPAVGINGIIASLASSSVLLCFCSQVIFLKLSGKFNLENILFEPLKILLVGTRNINLNMGNGNVYFISCIQTSPFKEIYDRGQCQLCSCSNYVHLSTLPSAEKLWVYSTTDTAEKKKNTVKLLFATYG